MTIATRAEGKKWEKFNSRGELHRLRKRIEIEGMVIIKSEGEL